MPLFTEDAVYPVPPPRLIGGAARHQRGHLIAECGRTNGGACRACNRERQHRSQS